MGYVVSSLRDSRQHKISPLRILRQRWFLLPVFSDTVDDSGAREVGQGEDGRLGVAGSVLIPLTGNRKDVASWIRESAQNTRRAPMDLAIGWPRCPRHDAWMQPTLKPRQWRCNVPMSGGSDFDGKPRICPETKRYRWWRSFDRNVFAYLYVAMGCYFCPVCERVWGNGVAPPQDRLCMTCFQIGIEHNLQLTDCGQCERGVHFFGAGQLIFGIRPLAAYCRKCRKFLCWECVLRHACSAEEPTLS